MGYQGAAEKIMKVSMEVELGCGNRLKRGASLRTARGDY
jgi:hypothetical protein